MVGGEKMRGILTIIRGNFRKGKGAYISIGILLFVVSVSLVSVMTIYSNSRERDIQVLKEDGFGDILGLVLANDSLQKMGTDEKTVVSKIRQCEAVERVKEESAVYAKLANEKNSAHMIVMDYQNQNFTYTQYDEQGEKIERPVLKNNEISVPVSFKGLYDFKIGDNVTIGGGKHKFTYQIASYFEDPYMGSSMIGIKTVLVNEKSMQQLQKTADLAGESYLQTGKVLSIFKKNKESSDEQFERKLNEQTSYATYCWITMSQKQAVGYMLLLTNIFSGVLVVFVLVLLGAAMIVLSHNIRNGIEQNYENLGILKALGITSLDMQISTWLSYLIMAVVGTFLGIPVASLLVRTINKITMPATGLYVSSAISIPKSLFVCMGILLVTTVFTLWKTKKVVEITPIMAMREGKRAVHFSSRFRLPISKKGLGCSLAYRQFISAKKQYVSSIFITGILMVFMILVSTICNWLEQDSNIGDMLMATRVDLSANYSDEKAKKQAEKIIRKYSDFETYHMSTQYLLLEKLYTFCYVVDDPEQYTSVYKGRTCKYENEIMVTQYIADEFKVKIGDRMEVKNGERKASYIISGIYESSNDAGKNFAMSQKGLERLQLKNAEKKDTNKVETLYYVLSNQEKTAQMQKELKKAFAKDKKTDFDFQEDNAQFAVIVSAVQGLTVIIYLIGAVFVCITVILVCSKVFVREKQDFGIYKAMGYDSHKLRIQLALRFSIVALIGSFLGILVAYCVSDRVLGFILSAVGIYHFHSEIQIVTELMPMLLMVVIYFICAYMTGRKIKKVKPRVLIVE